MKEGKYTARHAIKQDLLTHFRAVLSSSGVGSMRYVIEKPCKSDIELYLRSAAKTPKHASASIAQAEG